MYKYQSKNYKKKLTKKIIKKPSFMDYVSASTMLIPGSKEKRAK